MGKKESSDSDKPEEEDKEYPSGFCAGPQYREVGTILES